METHICEFTWTEKGQVLRCQSDANWRITHLTAKKMLDKDGEWLSDKSMIHVCNRHYKRGYKNNDDPRLGMWTSTRINRAFREREPIVLEKADS